MREYTATDNLIVHGFAHQILEDWEPPPPGSLFHRCIVCPTKDNVPKGHKKDKNGWAIFNSFVHDGNFSGQHTVSRQPDNNVPLYPGTGAFQHPDEVKADIQSMKTDKQLREEAEHLVRPRAQDPLNRTNTRSSLRRTSHVISIKPRR